MQDEGRGMQTEQLLRVSQVSACRFPRVDVLSPRCASVCVAFMVTDSFHLSCPFTLKRQLPAREKEKEEGKKRSSLDSFSSSPAAAAVDSSAQESPLRRSHPFKPASQPQEKARERRDFPARRRGLKTARLLMPTRAFSVRKRSSLHQSDPASLRRRQQTLYPCRAP